MTPALAIVSPLKENQDGKLLPGTLPHHPDIFLFWAVFWTSLYKLKLLLENNQRDQLRPIEFGIGGRSLGQEDKGLACMCGPW